MSRKPTLLQHGPKALVGLIVLTGAAILAGLTETAAEGAEATTVFYVAPNGSDTNPGDEAKPFATLARARDAIRQVKAKSGGKVAAPVKVLVRGGKYFLAETLVIGPQDSGTRESPITYMAYPGEKPVISGGRRLIKWTPYRDKILRCEVPEAKGGKWKFRSLFLNGKRQIRARYPNFDPKKPIHGGWAFMENYSYAQDGKSGIVTYKPGTFPRHWAKPGEGEVNMFVVANWHNDIVPVRAVNEQNRTITLTRRTRWGADRAAGMPVEPVVPPIASWWGMQTGGAPGCRFRVENVLEELDQPGEWCLDSKDGIVFFWPPEADLENAEVIAPMLDRLVDLQDTSHITISGLTFAHTVGGDNQHPPTGDGYGPMFPLAGLKYCGDAIHLRGTNHCIIEDNTVIAPDGNGIYLEGHNTRNVVRFNEISNAGATSISLLGSKQAYPLNNQVSDNSIRGGGVFDRLSPGIFLGVSRGNTIAHNRIEDVPHSAINLGNNGYGRNIVEYNEIRRACQEASESAAIYCWHEWSGPLDLTEQRSGHVIRYNWISDLAGSTGREGELETTLITIAIFLDNTASNCFVYGNTVVRSPVGISPHGGGCNIIENNIFADCNVPVWWAPYTRPELFRSNTFCRNILYFTRPSRTKRDGVPHQSIQIYGVPHYIDGWNDTVAAVSDHNLIFNTNGGDYPVCSDYGAIPWQTFADWQKMGYDAHTAIADPMFVDAARDDYRLKPGSPAFKLGFLPIDACQIGPRKKGCASAQKQPGQCRVGRIANPSYGL